MRPYVAMARIAWRNAIVFRVPFLMGLTALVFNLLAMLALWRVLLESGQRLGGFSWPEMRTYLLIAFLSNCLISTFTDFSMSSRIRSGMVVVDMVRPADYQRTKLAECLGFALVELIAAVGVCAVAAAFFGGVVLPPPPQLALFLASMIALVPLKFVIVYMCGLLCFWTENHHGISLARTAVAGILSGAVVPLSFLPDWLRVLAGFLPFQATVSTPALLFLGHSTGTEALRMLGVQVFWVLALWWGARLAWNAASRQLTVHGG